ncbi:epsilon-sarcoglycan isoform X1 [Anabrus simplex]|uniref:epsilon-sarcoglycan isoform X1 n=1 Tax=Anabrus simplex TaxID=316456 RepID=UPI0034DCDFE8
MLPTIGVLLLFLSFVHSENVHMTKVFILPIEPGMFNWTLQGNRDQFSYRPSLLNAPDLPTWMHYIYSKVHHTGFLYGVPPVNQPDLELEIVGLNRRNYETRRRVVNMNIQPKEDPARYEVQLKIDNLNVEDMFDSYRLNRLLDVFRRKLWQESEDDLYVTFLASAVQLGARLPLKPNEGEGVVLRLGSRFEFSSSLVELQEEVKPLWKLGSCPRDFKRTSVDRLFREEGFALDWCAFRLLTVKEADRSSSLQHSARYDADLLDHHHHSLGFGREERWSRPSKSQVPQRSYISEFAFTILVPMFVMIILVIILSLILCFHHEGMDDDSSTYFESVFDIFEDYFRMTHCSNCLCDDLGNQHMQLSVSPSCDSRNTCSSTVNARHHAATRSKRNKEMPAVQMVQYSAVHRATHTLRSLSSQRDVSNSPSEACSTTVSHSRTASPNSSLPRTSTPRVSMERNSYYRPNPPPYSGSSCSGGNRADF